MKCISLFTTNNRILIESLEFLSIIYSVLTIIIVYKIMKEIGFDDKQTILPIILLTFHPLFIFLSRLVNTDGLVNLLMLISVLYLIKWYKNPTYKNISILAISIGLAGMTKTSVLVMAIPIIFVYMKKVIKEADNFKLLKTIIFQGLILVVITLPMIFWYQFRNYYKFNQPFFGIVEALDILKVKNNSFGARWILNQEFFNEILEKQASNVWANLIISSINFSIDFDAIPFAISMMLRGMSLIFIIISIISIIKNFKNEENKDLLSILLVTYISWIFGYIYFNYSLPYSCTIHARYIVIAIIIGIIYIGILFNNSKKFYVRGYIYGLVICFSFVSIAMFIYLMVIKTMINLLV